MARWRILCTVGLSLKPDALRPLEEVADVDYAEARRDLLLERIGVYDGYYVSAYVRVDKEILDRATCLKVIATPGTGTDHIDVDEARRRGIVVMSIATDYEVLDTFSATAEMAWCLLLSCIRRLPVAFEAAKRGDWARERFSGHQLRGRTLGVLGYGRLGKMVARFGQGFGMRVLACDKRDFEIPGVERADFDTLLAQSDVLTIHIHLTEDNRGLLSREVFAKMKPGIVIINTSRGAIVDEAALLDALESGHVSAAGLDVIDGEWRTDLADHPLIRYAREHDNLIITPHIAGATVESIVGAREHLARKLADYIRSRAV